MIAQGYREYRHMTEKPDKLTPATYIEITTSTPFVTNEWKQDAECLEAVSTGQVDPMLWFPVTDKKHVPPVVKALCERCPVRLECLSLAIYTNEKEGIWGGHSPKTVERMGRKMRQILRGRI